MNQKTGTSKLFIKKSLKEVVEILEDCVRVSRYIKKQNASGEGISVELQDTYDDILRDLRAWSRKRDVSLDFDSLIV